MTSFRIFANEILANGDKDDVETMYTQSEDRAKQIAEKMAQKYRSMDGDKEFEVIVVFHRDSDGMTGYINPLGADFHPENWI